MVMGAASVLRADVTSAADRAAMAGEATERCGVLHGLFINGETTGLALRPTWRKRLQQGQHHNSDYYHAHRQKLY